MLLATTIITPSDIYWITRFDGINHAAGWLLLLFGIVSALTTVFAFCAKDGGDDAIASLFFRVAVPSSCAALACVATLVFTPTTKEAILICGLPAIVNNEKVQAKASEALDGTEDLLKLAKGYVADKLKAELPAATTTTAPKKEESPSK